MRKSIDIKARLWYNYADKFQHFSILTSRCELPEFSEGGGNQSNANYDRYG